MQVLMLAEMIRAEYSDKEQLALAAEMQYCFENEMVAEETDFAIRRTGMIYFDKQRLDTHLDFISGWFSKMLNRNEEAKKQSSERFRAVVKEVTDFK